MTITIPQQLAKRAAETEGLNWMTPAYMSQAQGQAAIARIVKSISTTIPLEEYEALRVAAEPFVRNHLKVIQTTRCEDALYAALSALNEKLKGME